MVPVLIVLAVLVAAYAGLTAWVAMSNQMLPNTTVGGIELGGLDRAEALAKQMQLAGSPEGTRFALLFDDLQQKAGGLMDMLENLLEEEKTDAAQKYKTALVGALRALIQQVEEVGT